ncbi:hypothetical protein Fmac_014350 [Flemingia macrophylla]|uniref:Uncharacterized protein n=1 Tax=Flemingia macrophylla TaxID=520843 RepID=A0ABD1MBY7_9FABA
MALQRRYVTAIAIVLSVLLMFTCNINIALASSGGVMGGSFFDSESESSSASYASYSERVRMHYYDNHVPSPDAELAKGSHVGVSVLFLIFMLGMFLFGYYKDTKGNTVTVVKLQVAMPRGMGSSIQKDLTSIAETADTSSRDGVSCLLIGYSFVYLKQSKEDGEKYYNQLSDEERAKFNEETLLNLNNTEKRSTTTQSDVFSNEYSMFDVKEIKEGRKTFEEEKLLNGFGNGYIVITMLVAAKGAHKLSNVNGAEDLKRVLQKLRTLLLSCKLLADEVLWTPQKEDDTLSKQKLLEDYPQLAKGMFLAKKHE